MSDRFWEDVDPDCKKAFLASCTQEQLDQALSSHPTPPSGGLCPKYQILYDLALENSAQELLNYMSLYSNNPDIMAEQTWRKNLRGGKAAEPDLRYMYNLAANLLYCQKKYAEAEGILRASTPLIGLKMGANSAQAIGSTRDLSRCVLWQGRYDEARELLNEVKALVSTIADEAVRAELEEVDADTEKEIDDWIKSHAA